MEKLLCFSAISFFLGGIVMSGGPPPAARHADPASAKEDLVGTWEIRQPTDPLSLSLATDGSGVLIIRGPSMLGDRRNIPIPHKTPCDLGAWFLW